VDDPPALGAARFKQFRQLKQVLTEYFDGGRRRRPRPEGVAEQQPAARRDHRRQGAQCPGGPAERVPGTGAQHPVRGSAPAGRVRVGEGDIQAAARGGGPPAGQQRAVGVHPDAGRARPAAGRACPGPFDGGEQQLAPPAAEVGDPLPGPQVQPVEQQPRVLRRQRHVPPHARVERLFRVSRVRHAPRMPPRHRTVD